MKRILHLASVKNITFKSSYKDTTSMEFVQKFTLPDFQAKNFNIRTCEHMILGQLRMGAHQAKNAPLELLRWAIFISNEIILSLSLHQKEFPTPRFLGTAQQTQESPRTSRDQNMLNGRPSKAS